MRSVAAGCLCLFLSLSFSAFGQTKGVSVDSFRVIKTDPDYVDIELTGSNDGSLGTLCLDAHAKSDDGLVRSGGFIPLVVPVGQKLTITTHVLRPRGLDKLHTDYLFVMVYPCGKSPVLTRKLDWKYDWPDKSASTTSVDEKTQASDSAARAPWWLVTQSLEQEDYFALDQLLEKWNDPIQRDINGEWKLNQFKGVLWSHSGQDRKWKEDLERIRRWRKFNPKSAGAAIAEATYWIAYAWNIRGSVYTPSVDPVAVRVFGERMKRAEQVLKASKKYSSNNPLWYATYMEVAVATRRDVRFTSRLFEEGIRKHPRYEFLYLIMANYWSPIDGGNANWQKVHEVIANAVVLTAATEGSSNYARLYRSIDASQRLEFDLFEDGHASWPKMRDSFDELIEHFPSSENINEFASYACQAEDKDTYLRLRARIKDRILPYRWRSNYSPDMCDHKFMLYS